MQGVSEEKVDRIRGKEYEHGDGCEYDERIFQVTQQVDCVHSHRLDEASDNDRSEQSTYKRSIEKIDRLNSINYRQEKYDSHRDIDIGIEGIFDMPASSIPLA